MAAERALIVTPKQTWPIGHWIVVDDAGVKVASGFLTNREAWAWIDRNSATAVEDDERNARIGRAVGHQ